MPHLGYHVNIDRSLKLPKLLPEAEVIQVFMEGTATQTMFPRIDTSGLTSFRTTLGSRHLYYHASLIQNLGTSVERTRKMSVGSLATQLRVASILGARGVVSHGGSYTSSFEEGLSLVRRSLDEVFAAVPGKIQIIIENSAGAGRAIAGDLPKLVEFVRSYGNDRLKICIDFAHLHAAVGIDQSAIDFLATCQDVIAVYHWNQTAVVAKSKKDAHAACLFQMGQVPLELFQAILRITRSDMDLILERSSDDLVVTDMMLSREWLNAL